MENPIFFTIIRFFVKKQSMRKSLLIMGFSLCFVLFFIACQTKKSNLLEDAYLFNQDLGVEVIELPKFLAEKEEDHIEHLQPSTHRSLNCRENTDWWIGRWRIDVDKNLGLIQLNQKEQAEFRAFLEALSQDFLIQINRRTTLDLYVLGVESLNIPYLPADDNPRFELHAQDQAKQDFRLSCLENGFVWWKNAKSDGLFLRLENSNQSSNKDD